MNVRNRLAFGLYLLLALVLSGCVAATSGGATDAGVAHKDHPLLQYFRTQNSQFPVIKSAAGDVNNDGREDLIVIYSIANDTNRMLVTNHKVTLHDGRTLSAMCAIDAMGVASTIKQDIVVESRCSMCGTPISVKITDENIVAVDPADTHVLHVDLNRIENWAGSC